MMYSVLWVIWCDDEPSGEIKYFSAYLFIQRYPLDGSEEVSNKLYPSFYYL